MLEFGRDIYECIDIISQGNNSVTADSSGKTLNQEAN